MDNIDQYDLEFINEHCPEGQVPVFFVKGLIKYMGVHQTIKSLYRRVGNRVGRRIPCLPAINRIVVKKDKKNNYVWAYYATPEDRDLIRAEKHRLMNFNFREQIIAGTSCFSFNDDGESNSAFCIPLGKIKTSKDISKNIAHIENTFLSDEIHFHAIPDENNGYTLNFTAFPKCGKTGFDMCSLSTAHARIQLELLKEFKDCQLTLCDTNGNYYSPQKMESIIANKVYKKHKNNQYSLVKYPINKDDSLSI